VRPETKLDIALRGLRIDPDTHAALAATTLEAQTLELLVGDHTHVSAPIDAAGTAAAPFDLRGTSDRCWLSDPLRDGDAGIAVRLPSPPRFYGRQTSSGVPM